MTPEIQEFVRSLRLGGKVLEVGSLDVNGNVRHALRRGARYVGLDLRRGPNVQVQASGYALPFADGVFNTVLCLDTLEHDAAFWRTVPELRRVLRRGGRLVVTVPGIGFPKHDQPSDFYLFTVEAVRSMFTGMKQVRVEGLGDYAWAPPGAILVNGYSAVFGHGVK